MRKVKAAAAREATDAKRRQQAEEGQLNPMRRHSRAVRGASRGRGRRGVRGARRASRRGSMVGSGAAPYAPHRLRTTTISVPGAFTGNKASRSPSSSGPATPLGAHPRRASFAPRAVQPQAPAAPPMLATAKSRRAARSGRRRSTLVMSANPLLAKQSSAAAAAAAGSRTRAAALRGRRNRRTGAHGLEGRPMRDGHSVAGVHD